MISRLDPASERFLFDLSRLSRRLERAHREISSGKRIASPSDAPNQVANLVQTRLSLDSAEQLRNNFGRVKTEVDTAESAIASAVKMVELARVAGVRGSNTTATAETRAVFAAEVAAAIERIVAVAATSVEGRFIFSGDSDDVPPYTLDAAATLSAYAGSAATREMLHPNGTSYRVSRTAEEIFDNPGSGASVLDALEGLRSALAADDQSAIESALLSLGSAADHLNSIHASYGLIQSQLDDAIDDSHRTETRLHARIASIEDADVISAALEITEAQFQREAALNARGRRPRTTLFDYLG